MNVAIIGCGRVGHKRAQAVRALGHKIIGCGDIMIERAVALAEEFAEPTTYAATDRGVLSMDPCPDAFIVATPHDVLGNIARCAASRGAHVFIEKPGARRADELTAACVEARRMGAVVRVGYNLQFHPAIRQARAWLPEILPLLYIKGYYGHGGRLGYEQEWRLRRWKSGGGVGMDMMPHLIHLCQLFTGEDFEVKSNSGHTMFWKTPVEDNLWLFLRGRVHAELHASWTEWRNTFHFELVGQKGKITIQGLGGSYGVESCSMYLMGPEMGPPDIMRREYPKPDDSWTMELAEFFEDIRLQRQPSCGIPEAQAVLRLMESAGYCIPANATPETV